jgi:hypothetical protein
MASFKDILGSETGIIIFSVILGLGLAAMFRRTCTGDNCVVYQAPEREKIEGKIFAGDIDPQTGRTRKCYAFRATMVPCVKQPISPPDIQTENQNFRLLMSREEIEAKTGRKIGAF